MRCHIATQEDRERINELLKKPNSNCSTERLIGLRMGFNGEKSVKEIAKVVGHSEPTLQRWFDRYRNEGLIACLRPKRPSGRSAKFDEEIESYLLKGLKNGRWNTAVQAQVSLEKHFNKAFKYKTVWYWLKKCAGVIRVPRPVHVKQDSTKVEKFKRQFYGLHKDLPLHNDKPVKIWFADESRYGLLPVKQSCWTLKGM